MDVDFFEKEPKPVKSNVSDRDSKKKKYKYNRVSPVQLHRYKTTKQNIDVEQDSDEDNSHLTEYLDELEEKIDQNTVSNEELYSQIIDLREKMEKIERVLKIVLNKIKSN